jgi:hypothetical protein
MMKCQLMTLKRNNIYYVNYTYIFIWYLVYWRCDEGKGLTINDMSDNEINTKLESTSQWSN